MASIGGNSTSSSASTRATTHTASAPVYDQHGVSELYTSNTDGNPFRRFVRCPQRWVSGCKYFEWVDDEMPEYYLGCVQRLKLQKESVESQLQYKNLMIKTLYEKLDSQDARCEGLKATKITVGPAQTSQSGKSIVVVVALVAVVFAALYQIW